MSIAFHHVTLGQRVLFGSGQAAGHLVSEVERLQARRPMVIASSRQRDVVAVLTSTLANVLRFEHVVQHVPATVAAEARAAAAHHGADLLVCVGGGSATGLAKAVALTTGLPVVAIPTTFSGSEATNVWGLTDDGRKITGIDDVVLPASIIYDATLVTTLEADMAVASGMNALAHCIDSMWAPRADPINKALASEGIRAVKDGLLGIRGEPEDLRAGESLLYGSYLSAVAFASAGSGMHHKICHVLGGRWNTPHAQTHAVILPYVLAFNAPAAPEATARISHALEVGDAVEGLDMLRTAVQAPRSLRDLGFSQSNLNEAVQLILPVIPPSNPRPVSSENLAALLHGAWAGLPLKSMVFPVQSARS